MKHKISLMSLVMITVVSVDSIRNLPAAAKFGPVLITYYILAAIFFLMPCALVSAELAGKDECDGGIYTWVRSAYGNRAAVVAIWLQWIGNVIWYPTILSFAAGTLTSVIAPELATNNAYVAFAIISIFLALTSINIRGIELSALFSTICSITGLFLPMILIIAFGIYWPLSGNELAISITPQSLIPKLDAGNSIVSLTAIMLSFSGVEIATVHAKDVDNPQQKFPKAMAYASSIILLTLMAGSLAIAVVLPANEINLITGIIQSLKIFFHSINQDWAIPVIAISLAIGAAGSVSNWIIAPTKGLLFAAKDGNLPHRFTTMNKYDAPNYLLKLQALIVIMISLIFVYIPNINESYWVLTVTATQLYMIMYIMMFMSFLKLRYRKEYNGDAFKVPFGFTGAYVVALFGIIGCLITFFVSFLPPDLGYKTTLISYDGILIAALIFSILPPFFLYKKA